MTTALVVSVVLQWLVIALLVAVVIALLRNQGALARRLDGEVAPTPVAAPALHADIGMWTVPTVAGGAFELGGRRPRPQLVVLWSPGCARCTGVPDALRALFADARPAADVLAVLAASEGVCRQVAAALPAALAVARRADFPDALLPAVDYPYAFAVTDDGVLAAVGAPVTVADLAAMGEAADAADLERPGAVRDHPWGRSVPYWDHRHEQPHHDQRRAARPDPHREPRQQERPQPRREHST